MYHLNDEIPIRAFTNHDEYDGPIGVGKTISATGIIKPVKGIVLAMQNKLVYEPLGISDMLPSAFGTAAHLWMERALYCKDTVDKVVQDLFLQEKPTISLERRSRKRINGWVVSGKYDIVINGTVHDLKTCSVWSEIFDSNSREYTLQGSIYRWLNQDEIHDDEVVVTKIFTDWSSTTAKRDSGYPQERYLVKRYPLLTVKDTEKFIAEKLITIDKMLEMTQEGMPDCTDHELWASPTKYKVYKTDKSKKAMRGGVHDSYGDAVDFMNEKGGVLKTIPGEIRRCKYCPANTICNQCQEYISLGLVKI